MQVRVPSNVVSRELSGQAVILNLVTGTYFGIDDVGARMWALLCERKTADEIVRAILSEYDVQEAKLRADVDAFIRQLCEKGLVSIDA